MAHQGILGTISESSSQPGVAAGLVAGGSTKTDGLGLVTKGQSRQLDLCGKLSSRIDKPKLRCNHCGMTKHTKDQCFKLVGYPEWWSDGHKKPNSHIRQEGGKAAAAVGNMDVASNSGGTPKEAGIFCENASGEGAGKGFDCLISNPHISNSNF